MLHGYTPDSKKNGAKAMELLKKGFKMGKKKYNRKMSAS